MIDDEFIADNEFFIDDLYDMDEVQLRKEVEQYARLARRYPHPTTRNQMAYQFAYLTTQRSDEDIGSEEQWLS